MLGLRVILLGKFVGGLVTMVLESKVYILCSFWGVGVMTFEMKALLGVCVFVENICDNLAMNIPEIWKSHSSIFSMTLQILFLYCCFSLWF